MERTIRFMISWPYHPWFLAGEGGHFIVELVEEGFVDVEAVRNGSVGQETLEFFFQPVVGICDVSG